MSEPNWERLQELLDITKAAHSRNHFIYSQYFFSEEAKYQTDRRNAPTDIREENWCGTSACFAGHAVCRWENELWVKSPGKPTSISWYKGLGFFADVAGGLLGLSDLEQNWLFCAFPDESVEIDAGTDKDIDRKLRKYLKKTGKSLEELGIEYLEYTVQRRKFKRPDKYLKMRLKALKKAS